MTVGGLDTTAIMGFLGLVAGGAIAFAREQVKWYQERDGRWEKILETQQDTLEAMEQRDRERHEAIVALLKVALKANGGER